MYLNLIKQPQRPFNYVKHKVTKVYEIYISEKKRPFIVKDYIDEPGGFIKFKLVGGGKTLIAARYVVSITRKQLIRVISKAPQNQSLDAPECLVTEFYLISLDDLFKLETMNSEDVFLEPYKTEKTIVVNPDNTPSDGSPRNPLKMVN